jgi:uncharacterized membrane protein YeaQ/YmgE (transglycosylase-associated protein family)
MGIIGFLVFGLIVGLIARAIFPGRQAMGWIMTAVLGMVGSLVGGMIGQALFGGGAHGNNVGGFSPGGWISSIIGALLVLWAYLAITGRRRRVA